MLGGGGLDEIIHQIAGPLLQMECSCLPLIMTGQSAITKGYCLPCQYVIHTVAPYLDENNNPQPKLLQSCYQSIFQIANQYNIRTIGIPTLGTGFYGFPIAQAAEIALKSTLQELQNYNFIERVVFALWDQKTLDLYLQIFKDLMSS